MSNVLHLAVNNDKKKLQVMKELSLENAILRPSEHYHDNIGGLASTTPGSTCSNEDGTGQTTTRRYVCVC